MPTLFEHLLSLDLDKAQARAALAGGKVSLFGVPTGDGGREVDPRDVVVNPRAPKLTPGRDMALVFRDEHLVVAYKPSGMLSVPAAGRGRHVDLISRVARIVGRAMPVHRIDEQTSGLMVLARSEAVRIALKDSFAAHDVHRRYLALVKGHPPDRPRRVETRLLRNRGDGLRGSVERKPKARWSRPPNQELKRAVTHLRGLALLPGQCALVQAELETGRTHQVRIHLAELGFPVLGDPLYAPRAIEKAAPRLALHAAELGFEHPVTGEAMRWYAPLADDLERLRRSLGKPRPEPKERSKGKRRRRR